MEDQTLVIQSLMYELRHGYHKNKPMEELQELVMTTFAGVFHGHGGDECSNYLLDMLPHHIQQAMYAEQEALQAAIESSQTWS
jgi:serine/threonine protein phosphatase PrpC